MRNAKIRSRLNTCARDECAGRCDVTNTDRSPQTLPRSRNLLEFCPFWLKAFGLELRVRDKEVFSCLLHLCKAVRYAPTGIEFGGRFPGQDGSRSSAGRVHQRGSGPGPEAASSTVIRKCHRQDPSIRQPVRSFGGAWPQKFCGEVGGRDSVEACQGASHFGHTGRPRHPSCRCPREGIQVGEGPRSDG